MVRANVFSGGVIVMDGRLFLRWWSWRETGWYRKGGDGSLDATWAG